jgi:hypothetical protein
MKSTALLLRTHLIDNAFVQSPSGATDWPCYLQSLPDSDAIKDNAVMIRDSIGDKDGRLMEGETIIHMGGTVVVRGKEYEDGWNKINDIAVEFDNIHDEDVTYSSGVIYTLHAISRHPVMPLGVEPGTKRRWLFEMRINVSMSLI